MSMRPLVVGTAMFLILPLALFALDFRTGEWVTVKANEQSVEDLYLAGGSVTHAGTAGGDVLAAGGNVLISGPVAADLASAGGTVIVVANVGDDARVVGGTVVLQSRVGGDALLAGGQVEVQGAGIAGDAVLAGGLVRVAAPIGGNLRLYGDEVFIDASVGGKVIVEAKKVTLGESARLAGDFMYQAKREAEIAEGAVIVGATEFTPWKRGGRGGYAGGALWCALLFLLALLAASLVFGLYFRRFGNEIARLASEAPTRELGRGFLTVLALPAASALLFVSIIGAGLGVVGMIAAVGFFASAVIVAPILVGHWLFKRTDWKGITLGALVFCAASLVPIVGWLAQCIVVLIALGALVRLKWETAKEWR